MTLPRFFARIHDALNPLLSGIGNLESFLKNKSVCLKAPVNLEDYSEHQAGFALAVNLCARLYPRLCIVSSQRVVEECKSIALKINPQCEIGNKQSSADGVLAWADGTSSDVIINASGWNITLDQPGTLKRSNVPTCLAAASIGVGELFRSVFADFLPQRRREHSSAVINLLTLADSDDGLPDLPGEINIGRVHLVGAGAIGQAMLYTLARVSAVGTLIIVDPEELSLSNLQRYVLANDLDPGQAKCALAVRALSASRLQLKCSQSAWDIENFNDGVEVVCCAVDSAATRLAIQASLPRTVYNAWTQPADLGWSRHEQFGSEPCLACLYWPNRPRPSQVELIAQSIRQHPLRVLGYLTDSVHVDHPLKAEQIQTVAGLPAPPDSGTWTDRAILEDIIHEFGMDESTRTQWQGRSLSDLYREGICGGALIRADHSSDSADIVVPLAHQSALAGIMLATQLLIASSPELRPFRPPANEYRIDVLAGFPQVISRPRQRTLNCLCSDKDFLERYREKWPPA